MIQVIVCVQTIEEDGNHSMCNLCKSDVKDDGLSIGYLKMKNELSFQKRESQEIVERKKERVKKIEAEITELTTHLKQLERQNKDFINILNPVEAKVRTLIEKSGYLQRALKDVSEREKLAVKVTEISERKAELNKQISSMQKIKNLIFSANPKKEGILKRKHLKQKKLLKMLI